MITVLNRNQKLLLTVILSGSFLIRILLAVFVQSPIRSDSLDYLNLASSILKGSYSLDGKATAYVGCGYPLFLSLVMSVFGDGQFFIRIIQSILEIGTGYFFFLVCLNFFNVKYSLFAVAIFSFFPSNIIFSQAILSESLFGFFSMLILYLILRSDFSERSSLIFITGILFGYAVLIRTAYFPAFILIPLYFFIFRRDLFKEHMISKAAKLSLIFVAGLILILAPWSIRNKIAVDTFSLGTTSGFNFWSGSNPEATGTYIMPENLPVDFGNEAERDKEFFKLGLNYAMENPLKFLILGIKKTGYLFSSERMAVLYFAEHEPGETSTQVYKSVNPMFTLIVNIPYFIVMLLGTWGLLALDKNSFFICGFIVIWILTVFVFIALARYHYVLIPFFIIGTVNVLFYKLDLLRKLTLPKKTVGIVFSLFLVFTWAAEFYLLIT